MRSFAGLQEEINKTAQTKGLAEGKKVGRAYCEAWKKDIELIKMNLVMEKNMLPPEEYKIKVADFNKQLTEMNMSIGAFNKMTSAV